MEEQIRKKIDQVANSILDKYPSFGFSIVRPEKRGFGDWTLVLSNSNGINPLELAQDIADQLMATGYFEKAEVANIRFINLTVKSEYYGDELIDVIAKGSNYGKSVSGRGKNVNVEYVSANPTGPLHIGNARSGPIGEAVANLYEFNGYKVEREFYVNDIGVQIKRFGNSLLYWHSIKSNPNLVFPEDGYPGEYIKETSEIIQQNFADEIKEMADESDKIDFFAKKGLEIMVNNIKSDLKLVGMEIHTFSYESQILNSSKSKTVIKKLEEKGFTVEKDGAVWFKNPEDPDLKDNDAVLIKSDEQKSLTYFANDIAYHVDKINRGADTLVDIWGANHFGHIPRMKAALRALGYSEDMLQIVLYQYVRLKRAGEAMSMGKRLGNFVTLRQVIEAGVDPDAFKYFILSQNSNTPMEFDIELAADTSEKNPVYYIKYAHARICSILRKAGGPSFAEASDGKQGASDEEQGNLSLLTHEKEVALYKELVKFPELVQETLSDFQIQRLPHFAYKIATLFHDFYGSCKVIGAETKELELARLSLIKATKIVIANTLSICGIEAPEKM